MSMHTSKEKLYEIANKIGKYMGIAANAKETGNPLTEKLFRNKAVAVSQKVDVEQIIES